ncbi:hypothetical protein P171DRAFT_259833 [Karstenula rhodostoma CBS 690.94]|uniref:Zn(2)-C6 fungal-type domain-containing protein n=1 Tax=Karstenula rhodostoma CBS 690.94 TaxID=1392251 RepID=A0A9P4PJV7_9PLEO|nr:hypothetical protein P171DRAFT_259833 [Karstenula rhodostoma CBS 690.94]
MAFLQPSTLDTIFHSSVAPWLEHNFPFHDDHIATSAPIMDSSRTLAPTLASHIAGPGEVAVRRRKRRLDYIKCESCRKDKQKCLPTHREWPQRCNRCVERSLPCSEGSRAQRYHGPFRPIATALSSQIACDVEGDAHNWFISFQQNQTTIS